MGRPADWLRSLIGLAHAQGLLVIAQGVDTEAQALALQALGVDGWQGLWVSPTLSLSAFENPAGLSNPKTLPASIALP